MELPERIAAIIKVNQHTAATFADAVGVQRSAISHILNGRNKPSLDLLQKILLHFPRVDAGWLITGKAPAGENSPLGSVPQPRVAEKETTGESKANIAASQSEVPGNPNKSIERIVVFYTDRTFDTYEPTT